MSTSETFAFSVAVIRERSRERSLDSAITVLDGHDRARGTGQGGVELALPSGLYTVQVERAGARRESVHRHAGPTRLELPEPQRYSAVPATDTETSREYYEAPAAHWSAASTAPALATASTAQGSLFVFVRAAAAESARVPLDGLALRILDYEGRELAALDAPATRRDEQAGWLAFHAAAGAGEYVLSHEPPPATGAPAREMALAVFAGWQTQVFMTVTQGVSFASASVLMGHGFRPDDRVAQVVDAALTGLQNRTDLLAPEERRLLLWGKFDNPMLGLVGAHALLRASDADRPQIDTVLGNLGRLLGPDAPDVRALRLIAARRRLGDPPAPAAFERPPLLRAGLEAVLEAAVDQPSLVPRGGLLERIAAARLVDSPWSTWQPLVGRPPAVPGWVAHYVTDAALQAAHRARDLDVAATAARASLPVASVAGAYDALRATTLAGPWRTIEMEKFVTRIRIEAPRLSLPPEEVRRLFTEGGDGERIRALALMQGDPATRDLDVAIAGISGSRSAFEQFHALKLAGQMAPALDAEQRRRLTAAVAEQRGPGGHITPGTDRWDMSEKLLTDLGAP